MCRALRRLYTHTLHVYVLYVVDCVCVCPHKYHVYFTIARFFREGTLKWQETKDLFFNLFNWLPACWQFCFPIFFFFTLKAVNVQTLPHSSQSLARFCTIYISFSLFSFTNSSYELHKLGVSLYFLCTKYLIAVVRVFRLITCVI